MAGRALERVEVLDPLWCAPDPPASFDRARGEITAVERRGKYLIVRTGGEADLLTHLRMTGNLTVGSGPRLGAERLYEAPTDERYCRARIVLDDGTRVSFTDARRFGTGRALAREELDTLLDRKLGIEPLGPELTAERIGELTAGRTAPLKSFLLDQSRIAGVGNIYADEALFRARLHPLSPAGSTRPEHWEPLRSGIVEALDRGLRLGGASIDDYRDANGEAGKMQDEFLVHTREAQPCPVCRTAIRRVVVSGRSTYFCPACQKRLRRRKRGRR